MVKAVDLSPASLTNKGWLSHVVFSPDSALSPCLSYIDEPWSPGSATTNSDDDASLASSIPSLSPNSDLNTFPGEPVEDNDAKIIFSPASRCLQNRYTTP